MRVAREPFEGILTSQSFCAACDEVNLSDVDLCQSRRRNRTLAVYRRRDPIARSNGSFSDPDLFRAELPFPAVCLMLRMRDIGGNADTVACGKAVADMVE